MQAPKTIAKRLLRIGYRAFAIDPISHTKIVSRNDLRAIGTQYGGWVIPFALLHKRSICYCVGCGEDISFDVGLIDNFECDVYGFDPTPRAIEHVKRVAGDNPKYHFYEFGIWDCEDTLKFFAPRDPTHVSHSLLNLQKTDDYIFIKVKRLSEVMREMGHNRIDILKLDIEGSEYKVIQSIIDDNIEVKILCVEFDECYNPLDRNYKKRVRESIKKLIRKGYLLVYAQGDGNYTFVKKD